MPHRIVQYQPTPNPNALKCFLDAPLEGGLRSFRTPAEGAADALARRLFAVPGVHSLLLGGDWLTVNKSPEAAWREVKAGVERALAEA